MTALSGAFTVPSQTLVAPALRPLLRAVIDSISALCLPPALVGFRSAFAEVAQGQSPQVDASSIITIRLQLIAQDGSPITQTFEAEDVAAALMARGFSVSVPKTSAHLPSELRYAPAVQGFVGPTWDGVAIRYEDRRSVASVAV